MNNHILKKVVSLTLAVIMAVLCVPMIATEVDAATEGYYYYTVTNGEATITDVDTSISGDIVIPDTLGGCPVTFIRAYAFSYCSSLTSVVIGDSVTTIGSYAFSSCSSLTNVDIGNSVTTIGSYAFYNCSSLTSVVIGDSVTTIDMYAFYSCTSLTSVVIGNSVTTIGSYAFCGCDNLTSVDIPDSVTSIGDRTFEGCDNLTSVVIPDSVTHIGMGAFSYTSYYNNSSNWKNNVLYIGNYLIDSKTSLSGSYTIKDGTLCIADKAFQHCDSLTSVDIPDSVTSIGLGAFYNCDSLTSITVSESNTMYKSIDGVLFTEDGSVLIQYPMGNTNTSYKIPDSVISIGDEAFEFCTSLTSVVIPDSVTTIGDEAFYDCTSLTSVIIPNRVISIGDEAFYDCTSLTSVVIPDSVTTIGKYVFYNTGYYNDSSNWENDVLYIGNYIINAKTSLSGSYTIKDGTLCIAASAFRFCKSLVSVVISDSVTSIADSAFSNCKSLTSVNIPDNVTSIGDEAFSSCTSLTSVVIPDSVTSIGNEAFYNCYSLKSVVIPDGVTTIGSSAFSFCSSLTSVVIGDSVTAIGNSAFSNCKSLTSVNIPDNVTSIGDKTFEDCSGLTSVVIPDNVTSIGMEAFYGCDNLTSVDIGDGVTSIGAYAFEYCKSLTSVVIGDSVTSIGERAFYECRSLTNVYIKSEDITKNLTSQTACDYIINHEDTVAIISDITNVPQYITDTYRYTETVTYNNVEYVAYSNHEHTWEDYSITSTNCITGGFEGKRCSSCGLLNGETVYAHTGGTATCVDKAVCDLCKNEYGRVNLDNHTDLHKVDAKAPTCTEIGWDAYEYCTECSYTTYNELPATGNHSGGTATCVDKAVCDVCKGEYGNVNSDNHTGNTEIRGAVEPTTEAEGYTGDTHCADCGAKLADGEVIPKLITPGDANGDGKVNLGDVSLILKKIAKWDVTIDTDASDVNDDGKVNLADVSLILKYIAKWDVVLK